MNLLLPIINYSIVIKLYCTKMIVLCCNFFSNLQPPFLRPGINNNIWMSTCSQDYHCRGARKCCLLQVARYHYKETCRNPVPQYSNNYWK